MRKLFVFVVVDLERLGKASDTPSVYGSLKELVNAKIEDKGVVLTYDALANRLTRNSDIHYWKNNRYVICKREVQRSRKITDKK